MANNGNMEQNMEQNMEENMEENFEQQSSQSQRKKTSGLWTYVICGIVGLMVIFCLVNKAWHLAGYTLAIAISVFLISKFVDLQRIKSAILAGVVTSVFIIAALLITGFAPIKVQTMYLSNLVVDKLQVNDWAHVNSFWFGKDKNGNAVGYYDNENGEFDIFGDVNLKGNTTHWENTYFKKDIVVEGNSTTKGDNTIEVNSRIKS